MVPAPVISTDLPSEIGAALDGVQRDGQRLRERELAQRHVARDRIALPLAHHEVLAEHALHVRVEAGAAEEAHVAAELLAALAAVVALAARVRRAHRHLVADLDPGDAGADRGDGGRRLVARNQRLAHDEAAVAALVVIMDVRTADAAGAQPQQHLAGADVGRVDRLRSADRPWRECGKQAWHLLLVTAAIERGAQRSPRAASPRAQCNVFQPLLNRLYALLRWRCIAARAPATSCSAIAFSTARCSAIAAVHSPGVS